MSSYAQQLIALADQFRETFATEKVDRNATNMLVHDALMKTLVAEHKPLLVEPDARVDEAA